MRCPTPRWPPTSPPPTSTSRSRSTRASGCRWSSPWSPGSRWSPAAPARSPAPWPTPAWCSTAADPAYVAAAVHRACTGRAAWPRQRLTAAGRRRAGPTGRRRGGRHDASTAVAGAVGPGRPEGRLRHAALRPPGHGWGRDGGPPAGRAPGVRHGWEFEVYTTCALDPTPGTTCSSRGTVTLNGVTVHRTRSDARPAAPTSTASTAAAGGPRMATREQSKRWVDFNGPRLPGAGRRRLHLRRRRRRLLPVPLLPDGGAIGKVRCPAVLHPAAHDEPALYLPVFRGTFADADAICYHTHGRAPARRAHVPGGRPAPDRAGARGGGVRGQRPPGRASWRVSVTGPTS